METKREIRKINSEYRLKKANDSWNEDPGIRLVTEDDFIESALTDIKNCIDPTKKSWAYDYASVANMTIYKINKREQKELSNYIHQDVINYFSRANDEDFDMFKGTNCSKNLLNKLKKLSRKKEKKTHLIIPMLNPESKEIEVKEMHLTKDQLDEFNRCSTGTFEKFKMTGYLGEQEFTIFDETDVYVTNKFNRSKGCMLTPKQVSVHDMLFGAEMSGNQNLFNNCRDIYRKNWPLEYSILID